VTRLGFFSAEGHDARASPFEIVNVWSGLHDVSVTKRDPFKGKFETVLWLKSSWCDPRLAWNDFVFQGSVLIDRQDVWTPELHFENGHSHTDLFTSPAVVAPDGKVTLEDNMLAQFLCSTTDELASFRFDACDCLINLGARNGVTLGPQHGFQLVESDPHFWTTNFVSVADPHNHADDGDQKEVVHYQLHFERRPFSAWVRLITPAIVINLVGFMTFWVPELPESAALGVVSLLCSLAFRETVEMPDTADATWTEIFTMVNVCCQASVMFITWCSYGSRMAHAMSAWLQWFHPKQVAKSCAKTLEAEDGNAVAPVPPVVTSELFCARQERRHAVDNNYDGQDYEKEEKDNRLEGNEEEIAVPPESCMATNQLTRRAGYNNNHPGVNLCDKTNPSTSETQRENDGGRDMEAEHALENKEEEKKREEKKKEEQPDNVDWVGRWIIVPSYIVVMTTLPFNGWGFT